MPWARKGSGFSLLMDSLIILMAQLMPVKSVADLIGEHDARIWRVLEHYVLKARSDEDFSEVESVGVDETSRAKDHQYVSVFVDLDKSKVLYVCEGKDASAIKLFKFYLEDTNWPCINLRNFCCDMSPAFISGVTRNFPETSITFDKFHVMKLMNQAVDQVRREEQSHNSNLKHTRYIWLKNPEKLTKKQRYELGSLRDMGLKTMRAYNIKLSLRDFWNFKDPLLAEDYLKRWYFWATHSRLNPVIDTAKSDQGALEWSSELYKHQNR